MGKNRYYVVWNGVSPGVYKSWTDCKLQINGYEGALYKSFQTLEEAEKAYSSSPYLYVGKTRKLHHLTNPCKMFRRTEQIPSSPCQPKFRPKPWLSMPHAAEIRERWNTEGYTSEPAKLSFTSDRFTAPTTSENF